jgi:hypothetical protein
LPACVVRLETARLFFAEAHRHHDARFDAKLLIGSPYSLSASRAEGQVVLLTASIVTMTLEDEFTLVLQHARCVALEDVGLVHPDRHGVKVEEDRFEATLPVDATTADALLSLRAVFAALTASCLLWGTRAGETTLTVWTVFV